MNPIFVIDLAFGDCGKGTIVDYLTRQHAAKTVVRFNGGPQAAHNVVTPDGRHHTFAQFGSGTFVAGVRTVLSRHMLVEPYALFQEAQHLEDVGVPDALDRLIVDAGAVLITPCHQAANVLRELARGDAAHGTCGRGIGETMSDWLASPDTMLFAGDLSDGAKVRASLEALCRRKTGELANALRSLASSRAARFSIDTLTDPTWIDAAVERYAELARRAVISKSAALDALTDGTVIFEGAQGVLLDQDFGFHPHTTWSRTTFANADDLLREVGQTAQPTRIGVLRTYFTRHGAGPMVTGAEALRAALPEPHNADTGPQGRFRVGPFDAVAARYALAAAGRVDCIALTHLDRLPALPPKVCSGYEGQADGDLVNVAAGRIVELIPPASPDLARQERLTRTLSGLHPICDPINTVPEEFCQRLEAELRCPIRIVSHGPDASEKRMR